MLRILVSNDDGVYAPGIAHLETTLREVAKTTVVAPDRNMSGASHSLTLQHPIRLQPATNGYILCEGTPTDCVHLAITGYLEDMPDMVVSGINSGANLGDDVLYSGTVAAAMEGRFLGLPAIAVSLCSSEQGGYYETAAEVTKIIIKRILENPLPSDTILNINVPNCKFDELHGFEITRLGRRHCSDSIAKDVDPRGHAMYWLGPAGKEKDAGLGTDFYAIKNKKVSITPLQIDLTKHNELKNLQSWIKDLETESIL